MPRVHPTAVVEGEVRLADDVEVGPFCVLRGPVTLGAGTRLLSQVHLQGPLEIGAGNLLYPSVCLGFAPQSVGIDPAKPGRGLVVGDRNVFREGTTIHRAMTDRGPTRVGSDGFFMANAHVGHDAWVGNHVILANGALIGGHVRVEDRVFVGGNAAVHQFCRIGRGAMLSGAMAMSLDLPPFFMLTGINTAGSINLVGMRRSGMPRSDIDDVRWAYRAMYGGEHRKTPRQMRAALGERADRPRVAEILAFLEASERGILSNRPDPRRSG